MSTRAPAALGRTETPRCDHRDAGEVTGRDRGTVLGGHRSLTLETKVGLAT